MKKIVLLMLASVSMASFAADTADINVNINGRIKDQTCAIKTGYQHLIVNLPTVSIASLTKPGDVALAQNFFIYLEDCKQIDTSAGKTIFAFFEGAEEFVDENHAHTLKNASTATNKATHVNIQLLNKDGSAIKVTKDRASNASTTFTDLYKGPTVQADQRNYVLEYAAQYYATGKATAGKVTAVANYTIQYR